MNFELTRENAMIKDAIHDWVSRECSRDVVGEMDEKGNFPGKFIKKLAKLGFCGMTISEKMGGEGRNMIGTSLVTEEIATVYPTLARCYTGSAFYGGALISLLGTPAQQQRYLPECARGKMLVALAQTESDSGADLGRVKTRAEKNGSGYLVNGEKMYISNADQARLLLVLAQTGSAGADIPEFTLFCVDTPSPGITVEPVETLGYKGANACRVRLNDVSVDDDQVLGGGAEFGRAEGQLRQIRDIVLLAVTAEAVGLARGAFEYTLDYARNRVQFDQPIGTFSAIRRKFAEMAAEIAAARLMLYQSAWLADHHKPFSREVAMAKCLACEAARRTAMEGLQIFGGYGYTMEYDIQRYVRDAAALTSAGASLETLRAWIGEGLGL